MTWPCSSSPGSVCQFLGVALHGDHLSESDEGTMTEDPFPLCSDRRLCTEQHHVAPSSWCRTAATSNCISINRTPTRSFARSAGVAMVDSYLSFGRRVSLEGHQTDQGLQDGKGEGGLRIFLLPRPLISIWRVWIYSSISRTRKTIIK
jgi:hypothetical protein